MNIPAAVILKVRFGVVHTELVETWQMEHSNAMTVRADVYFGMRSLGFGDAEARIKRELCVAWVANMGQRATRSEGGILRASISGEVEAPFRVGKETATMRAKGNSIMGTPRLTQTSNRTYLHKQQDALPTETPFYFMVKCLDRLLFFISYFSLNTFTR